MSVEEVERDEKKGKVKIRVTGKKGKAVEAKRKKHKGGGKRISELKGSELADVVEMIAIRLGLADEDGKLL